MLTNLQDHVLHAIFIVVCTINTADTAKLFMIFRSDVIFMNKATKIIKSDAIIILMHYVLTLIVIIENHKQLKSTVLIGWAQGRVGCTFFEPDPDPREGPGRVGSGLGTDQPYP